MKSLMFSVNESLLSSNVVLIYYNKIIYKVQNEIIKLILDINAYHLKN